MGFAEHLPVGNLFTRAAHVLDYLGGPLEVAQKVEANGWAYILRLPNIGRKTADCIAAILVHSDLIKEPNHFFASRRVYEQCMSQLKGVI